MQSDHHNNNNFLNNDKTESGSRKHEVDYDLENLSRYFLDHSKKITCRFNSLGELEVKITGKEFSRIYNLTLILKNQPDFSNIFFNKKLNFKEIKIYENFILNSSMKPKVAVNFKVAGISMTATPSLLLYKARDPKETHDTLLYGEKLAITAYTLEHYEIINKFLRENGQLEELKQLTEINLTKAVKEIILTSVVASQGIRLHLMSRGRHGITIPTKPFPLNKLVSLYRIEETVTELNDKRKNQDIFINPQFTSTSTSLVAAESLSTDTKNKTLITILYPTPLPKIGISELSAYGREEEMLLPPNIVLEKIDYTFQDNMHCFTYTPVCIPTTNTYSSETTGLRSELIELLDTFDYDAIKKTPLEHFYMLSNVIPDAFFQEKLNELIEVKKIIDDYDELLEVAQFAYSDRFKKSYLDKALCDDDLELKTKHGTIPRPNHGLPNGVRPAMLLPYLIDYCAKADYKDSPYIELKNFCSNLKSNPAEISTLQKMLVFYACGRESEISWKKNIDKIYEYRKKSVQSFNTFMMSQDITEEDLTKFSTILEAGPAFFNQDDSIDKNWMLLFYLSNICHSLDLMRCYSEEEFRQHIPDFIDHTFVEIAKNLIVATGDRLSCTIENKNIVDHNKPYDHTLFHAASTNPKKCLLLCLKSLAKHNLAQPEKTSTLKETLPPIEIKEDFLISLLFNEIKARHFFTVKKMIEFLIKENKRHLLLSKNPNPKENLTPIQLATQLGYTDILQLLISEIPTDILNKDKLLHVATKNKNSDTLRMLINIDEKTDLFEKDELNDTIFDIAFKNKNENILEAILFNNNNQTSSIIDRLYTDKTIKNNNNDYRDSILCSLAIQHHDLAMLKQLITHIDPKRLEKIPLVYYTALYNNEEILEFLINNHSNVNLLSGKLSPLHIAINKCYANIVGLLIKSGATFANEEEKNTSFIYALKQNQVNTLDLLIQYGLAPDINSLKIEDISLLQFAIDNECIEIIKLFVSYGADLNSQTSTNESLLSYAIKKDNIDIVKIFLPSHTNFVIFDAISKNPSVKMLSMLLIHCFYDLNEYNADGYTILHYAILKSNYRIINELLKFGANPFSTIHSDPKMNALRFALENNQLKLIDILLDTMLKKSKSIEDLFDKIFVGFDIENESDNQFLLNLVKFYLTKDDSDLINQLFIKFPEEMTNLEDANNSSLLTMAAQAKCKKTCKLLLEKNSFDINQSNKQTVNPLKAVVLNQDIEMVTLFLDNHAKPQSALYIAAKFDTLDIFILLVKKCVYLKIKNIVDPYLTEALIDGINSNLSQEKALSLEIEKIKILVESGLEVNLQNDTTYINLLTQCIESQKFELVCYLLMMSDHQNSKLLSLIIPHTTLFTDSLINLIKKSSNKDFYFQKMNNGSFASLLNYNYLESSPSLNFNPSIRSVSDKIQSTFPEYANKASTKNIMKIDN